MAPSSEPSGGQPFVGRDRERALLRERVSTMLAGTGGLVVISGGAGIGKTSLVRDLVDDLDRDSVQVLTGGCYDLTTTPPFSPWIEALSDTGPVSEDGVPPGIPGWQGAPSDVRNLPDRFEQIDRYIASLSEHRPLILVLEDIHWADDASLDLLRFVARRRGNRRVLLIATCRIDEVSPRHRLNVILPALVRESRPLRIDLRPLDPDAVRQIVDARYQLSSPDQRRLTEYLEHLGRGNPLYVEELMRTLEASGLLVPERDGTRLADLAGVRIPPLLQQTIARRLDQLGEAARSALALAAVIGQDVPVDQWGLLSGLSDAQLSDIVDEAIGAHVLEERPDSIDLHFSHALVRESMYRSLSLPVRRTRHRQVAESMAGAPNAQPHIVAYHFQQAGDARALEWFVRAGLRARSAAAWFSAAQAFASAAELLRGDSRRAREYGWLRFEAGFLERFSGEAGSVDHLNGAEQTGLEIPDPLLVAFSRYGRGVQLALRGSVRTGVQDIERGVADIDRLIGSTPVPGTEEHALTIIRSLLPDDVPAQDTRAVNRQRINLQRGVLINWLAMSGRYREAAEAGEQFMKSVVDAYGPGHLQQAQCVPGHRGLAHAYAALGRPDDARREFALAREGNREIRDYAIQGDTIWNEIVTLTLPYETDNLAERGRLLAEAGDVWDRCEGVTVNIDGNGPPARLQVDLLEGRWDDAVQMAHDHLNSAWIPLVQEGLVTIGTVARHRGEFASAWECIERLFPQGPLTAPGDSHFTATSPGLLLAAELAMDEGDLDAARQWIDAHAGWLTWSGSRLWDADTPLATARLHLLAGDLCSARESAEASFRLASDPLQPLRLVAAHRMLGTLDLQQGRLEAAEQHLRASSDLASRCGAVFERTVSQLELVELQVRLRRSGPATALLDKVRVVFRQLGAQPMLARVNRLEAQLAGLEAAGNVAPDGLTARECEVLRLVARGMSNREIASELFLSPRTVERHIANIYLKIDVHSKAEATAYAMHHRMV